MEQNHMPSSPVHHRPTSRDSNGGTDERPEQLGESSRTTLPHLARTHGGNSTSPHHTTAALPWPSEPPSVDSPMPSSPDPAWQTSTPTWNQEPFAAPSSTSSAAPPSSARPTSPPRKSPLARPPTLESIHPSRHGISSLLTSQPLDRCASSTSTSRHHSPSPCPSPAVPHSRHTPPPRPAFPASSPPASITGKRQHRSSSLPPSIPAYKRRRGYSPDQPLPSEQYGRTLVPLKKRASRLELQQARADAWARTYRRRPWTEVQTFVAARSPPINLSSLKTLDAHEILKSPTLRHDLIFDNIAFRPLDSPYPSDMLSAPSHAMLPPSTGRDENENGAHAADMYWEAIGHEIVRGCSCLRWRVTVEWPGGGGESTHRLDGRVREEECVCEGRRLGLTDAEWWEHQRTTPWPSRIPEMIQTLKEVLLSLMGSTTPCPNHFSYSFSQEALKAHEATCPTVTHALVPQVSAALDPEFLALQIRRGVMGTSVFELIGEAMKVHCAPLRDAMVDDMIQTARSTPSPRGSTASAEGMTMALRKCFACVEVMKLDIANHQVHALRPYLTSQCFGSEISSLKAYLAAHGRTMDTSIMRDWIRSASKEVLQGVSPHGRLHMMGECACRNNSELVLRSLATAFTSTMFNPSWIEEGVWPPHGIFERGGTALAAKEAGSTVELPESLRMDGRRLRGYHSSAVEIALAHVLILACRKVWTSLWPNSNSGKKALALADLAKEITEVLPGSTIREAMSRSPDTAENSDLAVYLAHRLLTLSADAPTGIDERAVVDEIARKLDIYIAKHLQPTSSLYRDSLARVKTVLNVQLTNEMLSLQHDPHGSRYRPSPSLVSACGHETPMDIYLASHPLEPPASLSAPAAARRRFDLIGTWFAETEMAEMRKHNLEPLAPALRKLVDRMAVLANFNVGVFGNYYRRKGMIVGA